MKRKADTTTPVVSSSPYDPIFEPIPKVDKLVAPKITPAKVLSAKVLPAKVTPARRESNRQIKKPKRDLPSEEPEGDQVSNLHNIIDLWLRIKIQGTSICGSVLGSKGHVLIFHITLMN